MAMKVESWSWFIFLSEFLASESNASEFCLSELNIDYSDKGLRSIFMKYGMRSKTSRVSKNFKTKIVFVPQFRNLIQNLKSALATNAFLSIICRFWRNCNLVSPQFFSAQHFVEIHKLMLFLKNSLNLA